MPLDFNVPLPSDLISGVQGIGESLGKRIEGLVSGVQSRVPKIDFSNLFGAPPQQEFASPIPDQPSGAEDLIAQLPIGEEAPEATPSPTPSPSPNVTMNFGRVTYYLPTGNLTSTGTVPTPDYTAAISPDLKDLLPMGTIIELPDGQRLRIEDLTSPSQESTLDIFRETPREGEGLQENVPFDIVGRDLSGFQYNY